jgi:hypothetical protein
MANVMVKVLISHYATKKFRISIVYQYTAISLCLLLVGGLSGRFSGVLMSRYF